MFAPRPGSLLYSLSSSTDRKNLCHERRRTNNESKIGKERIERRKNEKDKMAVEEGKTLKNRETRSHLLAS
jgi:hypothetical protein